MYAFAGPVERVANAMLERRGLHPHKQQQQQLQQQRVVAASAWSGGGGSGSDGSPRHSCNGAASQVGNP